MTIKNKKACERYFFILFISMLSFIFGSFNLFAEQPWFYYYKLGIENFSQGQYELALTAIDKAIELNASSSSRARTYGMNYIEYYPYFFRAACLAALGKYSQAKVSLEKEFSQGAINDSKDTLNKAYLLQNKIDAALQPPPEKKTPPEIKADTPPIKKNLPPEDTRPSFVKERQYVRLAIIDYFNGEYYQTISQLNQLPDNIPPHLKTVKHFFLGCSHASLYYLHGEKDKRQFQDAKANFNKVRMLPLPLRNKFGKLISPKIMSLFQGTNK